MFSINDKVKVNQPEDEIFHGKEGFVSRVDQASKNATPIYIVVFGSAVDDLTGADFGGHGFSFLADELEAV